MSRLSAALSSATQQAIPPEFGRKWGTECLNIRFPLPTLLCAGYSVKLILIEKIIKLSWYSLNNLPYLSNRIQETRKEQNIYSTPYIIQLIYLPSNRCLFKINGPNHTERDTNYKGEGKGT